MMLYLGQGMLEEVESSMSLQDYINMDTVNRTWTEQLLHVTKLYEGLRSLIIETNIRFLDITDEFRGRMANETCVVSAISRIGETVTNFSIWEKQTYYMDSPTGGSQETCNKKEDFQIRLAHDIVRGHGKMDEFVIGLKQHIQRFENSIMSLNICDESALQVLVMDLLHNMSGLSDVTDEMVSLYEELILSAQPHTLITSMVDSYAKEPVEYVRYM